MPRGLFWLGTLACRGLESKSRGGWGWGWGAECLSERARGAPLLSTRSPLRVCMRLRLHFRVLPLSSATLLSSRGRGASDRGCLALPFPSLPFYSPPSPSASGPNQERSGFSLSSVPLVFSPLRMMGIWWVCLSV